MSHLVSIEAYGKNTAKLHYTQKDVWKIFSVAHLLGLHRRYSFPYTAVTLTQLPKFKFHFILVLKIGKSYCRLSDDYSVCVAFSIVDFIVIPSIISIKCFY